jgi:hypothetical protein
LISRPKASCTVVPLSKSAISYVPAAGVQPMIEPSAALRVVASASNWLLALWRIGVLV